VSAARSGPAARSEPAARAVRSARSEPPESGGPFRDGPPGQDGLTIPAAARSGRGARAFILASTLWLALTGAWLARHTYDDVYIAARYAENLAAGQGMVFNAGDRVEGASDLLWVLVLALLRKVGIPVVAAAKIIGVVLVSAVPLVVFLAGRALPGAPGGGLVAAVFCAMSAPLAFWAGNGLEAGAQAFVVMLAVLMALRETGTGFPAAAPVFLAAALLRPEGVALSVPYLGLLWWRVCRGRISARAGTLATVIILGGVVAVTAFRLFYYGDPVPNTWWAKEANPALWTIGRGTDYLTDFISESGGWMLVFLAVIPLACAGIPPAPAAGIPRASGPSGNPGPVAPATPPAAGEASPCSNPAGGGALLVAGTLAMQVAFILCSGRDWMEGYRFMVPVIPLLCLLVGSGAALVHGALGRALAPRRLAVVAALAGALFAFVSLRGLLGLDGRMQQYGKSIASGHAALAEWLRGAVPAGTLLAIGDGGLVPYATGLPSVDLQGLTDRFIARHGPLEGARHVLLERRPGVLVLRLKVREPAPGVLMHHSPFQVDGCIAGDPALERDYVFLRAWPYGPDYDLHVYVRRDLAKAPARRTGPLKGLY